MSKARVAVLKVVTKELTVTAAAAKYGYSRQHLHRLLARYRSDGLDAVESRSRRPLTNARSTPLEVRERVTELETGEILSTHDINSERSYWRNKQKSPRRWPRL